MSMTLYKYPQPYNNIEWFYFKFVCTDWPNLMVLFTIWDRNQNPVWKLCLTDT